MTDTRTILTEDWQYDAIRVVIVNPNAQTVSVVQDSGPGTTPILKMTPYTPDDRADHEAGIRLPYAIARDLYEALARHFGDRPDPGSRELVDHLKERLDDESVRVDRLLEYVCAPPIVMSGPAQRGD